MAARPDGGWESDSYKKPMLRRPMTEALMWLAICSFHSRAKGSTAKIQSVVMDTAATRKDRAVWISRGLQAPSMPVCQFFLQS